MWSPVCDLFLEVDSMDKSLLDVVREALNLKRSEEFTLEGYEKERFKFEDTLLRWQLGDKWNVAPYEVLSGIIYGNYKIVKLPFQPKYRQVYWTYDDEDCSVIEVEWQNDFCDYKNKKLGIVFRTEDEAFMERPDKYEEITGKGWVDR